jgi:hypothetical protein
MTIHVSTSYAATCDHPEHGLVRKSHWPINAGSTEDAIQKLRELGWHIDLDSGVDWCVFCAELQFQREQIRG